MTDLISIPLGIRPADAAWAARAACAGAAGDFTPERATTATVAALTALAWRHCCKCPVAQACAAAADQHRDVGLRAGTLRVWARHRYTWRRLTHWAIEPQVAQRRGRGRPRARSVA